MGVNPSQAKTESFFILQFLIVWGNQWPVSPIAI